MGYNNFKSKAHCVFFLCYHVVWVTKFRYKWLHTKILKDLIKTLPEMASKINVNILEINGESDHLHFILELTPQDKLGSIIGALKCKSSSYLKKRYDFPYWGRHRRTLWSSGYFVTSTGGAPLDIIKKYIENQ